MSIASDLKSYADSAVNTAVSQSKQVFDTAQAQLNDVTGQANDIVGKATDAYKNVYSDVVSSAEKAVNLDALTTAIEPYLAQLKEYTTTVTDKVEVFVTGVRNDKRVAKLIDSAEPVLTVVRDTVNDRVVKPVQSLTGLGSKPATKPAPKPSPSAARKPATTKPATTSATVTRPAAKTAARKAPAKRTPKA